MFFGGDAGAVVDGVSVYRNPDGGFGHGLEPDGRGPSSQPLPTYTALSLLADVGHLGAVDGALAFVSSVACGDGGVPNALPSSLDHPRAPWWVVGEEGDLLMTALLSSFFHRVGARGRWLDLATEFCWERIEALDESHPYEVNACARFLDHVPDRPRAGVASARLGELVRQRGLVDLGDGAVHDGYAVGETHTATHYAPRPDCLARQWFSDGEMGAALDRLVAARQDDGGWTFPWAVWTPITEFEWRGIVTVDALATLRAYGRV
ncbi:hypothetical protein GCM10022243_60740 [Saccharothrix violaceirubra]